ncbi:hypothetical protein HMPREF2534_01387 [Bacteroides thetaiotaomicron]|nr:hypothetical protein HMPREF2534_01387 [Bacteroides thetaiotaomicron]
MNSAVAIMLQLFTVYYLRIIISLTSFSKTLCSIPQILASKG